jgi:hypothetical protein
MTVANEVGFGTYNTRRNLPPRTGRRRREANFVGAFLKAFMAEGRDGCWCGRHFAVPGCGVADCVVFRLDETESGHAATHLMAFEAKLMDWRKALAQAYRYRYYADESIIILPAESARVAIDNRHLFRQCGVGLWTLDPESGVIRRRIAPTMRSPLNARKREQALLRIGRRSLQLRKLRKEAEPLKQCR